jgi:plasmid stabilization system protein ParE
MKLRILEEAQQDLESSVDYYNEESPGLGYEFADEIYQTIHRIIENPDAWHPLSKRTRRCLAHRFPFAVVYQKRDQHIFVIAVMHLKRDPEFWKSRSASDQ